MKSFLTAMILIAASVSPVFPADTTPPRPKAGPVEIMKLSEVKPGMKAVA